MPSTSIPKSITVTGTLYASEDVTIAGRIHGDVVADRCTVSLTESAHVAGTISAADVTIAGRAEGTVLATAVVEMRRGADVKARLLTPKIILADGAVFNGTVEPQKVDAAKLVQDYRRKQPQTA